MQIDPSLIPGSGRFPGEGRGYSLRFSGQEACGILAPLPGIETTPPALEDEVLTIEQPGKLQVSVPYKSYT